MFKGEKSSQGNANKTGMNIKSSSKHRVGYNFI